VFVATAVPLFAQSTPINFIGISFSPITNSASYNYNWILER
jgi:hypothetical protein